MKRALFLAGVSCIAACASRDARPPPVAPREIRPVVEAPPPDTAPPALRPTPAASLVDAPADAPLAALPAAVPTHDVPLDLPTGQLDVRYARVELPDEAARAELDARMKAAVTSLAMGDGPVRGTCRATLATAELVSEMCELVYRGGREQAPGPGAGAVTFRLGPGGPRRVSPLEAFADGARVEHALCVKALGREPHDEDCLTVAIALAPDRLVARVGGYANGRLTLKRADVPLAELAGLVRRDGFLAFAAGDAPARPSPVAVAAQPSGDPPEGTGYGEPRGPAELAAAVLRARAPYTELFAVPAGGGRFRVATERGMRGEIADPLAASAGPASPVPWTPARVRVIACVAEQRTVLLDAPGGRPAHVLPQGTSCERFDGVVEGHDSTWSPVPGVLTYVAASGGVAGWAPSGPIAYDNLAAEDARPADDVFARALPPEAREAAAHDTLTVSLAVMHDRTMGPRQTRVARTLDASWVGVYDGASPLLFVRVEGRVEDVRTFEPGGDSLVAVASRVESDPAGIERWSIFAVGGTEPVGTLTARTAATLDDASRAIVALAGRDATSSAIEVTDAGTRHAYTWDGSRLVAAP